MRKESDGRWRAQIEINRNLLTTAEHLIRRIEALEKQAKELSNEKPTRRDDGKSESS